MNTNKPRRTVAYKLTDTIGGMQADVFIDGARCEWGVFASKDGALKWAKQRVKSLRHQIAQTR